jgi:hypothetical protein
MKRFFVAVDHSNASERALIALLKERFPADTIIRICFVVNPFMPPPATAVSEGSASLRWRIRIRAAQRLDDLERMLRFRNVSVETSLFETRMPQTVTVLGQALRWRADHLIVGIHSVLGIKRRLLEGAFKLIARRGHEPRRIGPNRDPGQDPARQYKQAA